ncbi:MAG: choice-of-anchor A family protein [Faecalibacterium sp.]|nr:choice-of-anchor A family protein [Faecalibacterium sp.]
MATVLCIAVAATFAGHIPIMANAEGSSGQTEAQQENTDLNTQAAAGLPAALTTLSAVQNGTLGTAPTATPSAAPAGTPSTTPTSTPGATPIGTPTATPAGTPTATPAGTPTATPAGTPSATPIGTPTATPTGTPTATPAGTPGATPAGTPTATPTGTPTATPTATPEALLYNMQNNQNMLGGTRTQFRWDKRKTAAENIENGLGKARHFAVFADGYEQHADMEGNVAVNSYWCCGQHALGNSATSIQNSSRYVKVHIEKEFNVPVTASTYFRIYCGDTPIGDTAKIDFANTSVGTVYIALDTAALPDGAAVADCHVYEMGGPGADAKPLQEGDSNGGYIVGYPSNTFTGAAAETSEYDTQDYIVKQDCTLLKTGLDFPTSGNIQGHDKTDTLIVGEDFWGDTLCPWVDGANFRSVTHMEWWNFFSIGQGLADCQALSDGLFKAQTNGLFYEQAENLFIEQANQTVQIYKLDPKRLQDGEQISIPYAGTKEQIENGTGPILVLNIDAAAAQMASLTANGQICLTASDDPNYSCMIFGGGGDWAPIASKIIWNVRFPMWSQWKLFAFDKQLLGTVLLPSGDVEKKGGNLVGGVIAENVFQISGEIHKVPLLQKACSVTVTCTNTVLGLPTGLAWDLTPFCLMAGASAFGFAAAVRRRRRAVRRGC